MEVDQDDVSDLFVTNDWIMDCDGNSQDSIEAEIATLRNAEKPEDILAIARTLTSSAMPRTSIIVIESKILKHLVPSLKATYLNIFQQIEKMVSSGKDFERNLQILQENLQLCIGILEILENIILCLLKKEQFDLVNVLSVPLNVVEILFVTFEHCKHSNIFYKRLGNTKEILKIFKAAHSLLTKLLILMQHHVHTAAAEALLPFLQFLVKVGRILSSTSMKAMADNWRGYIGIIQKFSSTLNGSYSIKDSLNSLAFEIEKNIKSLLEATKNVNSTTKLCNFLMKIVVKLCEILLDNAYEDWESIFIFLLNVYRYHPFLLSSQGLPKTVINEIEELVFCPLENLLEGLCSKPEFCEMLIRCEQMHSSSAECLLLTINVFKKFKFLMKSNLNISKLPQVIEIFFCSLSKGYNEFWRLITVEPSNQIYESNIQNMAQMFWLLPNKEFNQVERILFRNIFSPSIWNSLLVTDIWYIAIRENSQLCYETFCNITKHSEGFLKDDFTNRPQLIFLKNFLKRLGNNLSNNHKQRLIEKYPLNKHLHLWKGLMIFPKFKFDTFIRTVIDKSNLFFNKKSTFGDFKDLCWGLDALSFVPKHSEEDYSHLTAALINMWKFIFSTDWRDSFYSTYFITKLFPVTNHFLTELNNDQLFLTLTKIKKLLDADVDFKIHIISTLSVLAKARMRTLMERNDMYTRISEICIGLLACKNEIIRQNTLEVLFQFGEVSDYGMIIENVVKSDYELQTRVKHFMRNTITTNGTMNSEEYFRIQSNYKFCHHCPQLKNLKHRDERLSIASKSSKSVEVDNLLTTIKSDIELFCKLSGKPDMVQEYTTEIMRILDK